MDGLATSKSSGNQTGRWQQSAFDNGSSGN